MNTQVLNKTLRKPAGTIRKTGDELEDKDTDLEEVYLMCVDPSSRKTFKINIGTHEAEELNVSNMIKSKIAREMYKIDTLLDRQDHAKYWDFDNKAV